MINVHTGLERINIGAVSTTRFVLLTGASAVKQIKIDFIITFLNIILGQMLFVISNCLRKK